LENATAVTCELYDTSMIAKFCDGEEGMGCKAREDVGLVAPSWERRQVQGAGMA
jgi:hypothetical protein